jgi:hypothetical protein
MVTEKRGDTGSGPAPSGEAGGASNRPTESGAAASELRGVSGEARTPEELETLLEDWLVLRDSHAVAGLFEEGAVLAAGDERPARGGEEIARSALATWTGGHTYVADPRQVLQARDLALIVSEGAIHVARRRDDGSWRYAISLLSPGVSSAA